MSAGATANGGLVWQQIIDPDRYFAHPVASGKEGSVGHCVGSTGYRHFAPLFWGAGVFQGIGPVQELHVNGPDVVIDRHRCDRPVRHSAIRQIADDSGLHAQGRTYRHRR